jgi:4-amino-4-deoxy-L-arabinose transferase-like glycosyltransferase
LQPAPAPARAPSPQLAWTLTLVLVGTISVVRVAGLFAGSVELYPEEAQYWLWSRHLAFGYFSKPPLIAWTIAATTAFGNGEGFVRLGAPLAHAVAALALARAGMRLYGGWAGFWAAVLYSLAPGIQLSAAVIATDSLALAACALAVWAYAGWLTDEDRGARLRAAAGLGLAIGVGALAKYAIVYLVLGLALHAVVARDVRRRWRPAELAAVAGLALAVLAPNLVWNAAHGFQTLAHTAHDAAWKSHAAAGAHAAKPHANIIAARQAPGFILAQLATFGPVSFVALVVGAGLVGARRMRAWPADVALLCLAAPALVLMLAESVIARANGNWAAMAYAPASVLVAAWLLRWRARLWLGVAAATGAILMALLLAAALSPALANRIGVANSLKRVRGWRALTALTRDELARAGPVSAIAVDDRFSFNALAYYGRDSLKGAPPLRMWVREIAPHNEAETTSPLVEGAGRVLFVDVGGAYRAEAMRDFARVRPLGAWRIHLDANPAHDRRVFIFVGEDYRRRPRDPATGLPVPP